MIRTFAPPRHARHVEHADVYRRTDEFCAWPHTMGFWETGSGELVQNFMAMGAEYSDPTRISHDQLGERGGHNTRMVTVRSSDRGRTWSDPIYDLYPRLVQPMDSDPINLTKWGPFDYLNRDTLVANGSWEFGKPESRSFIRVSKDAGHNWTRPAPLPLDGLVSLSAINSHMVRPDGRCLLFLTEVSEDGWNRRPLVYASLDDGAEFRFLSFITPVRDAFGAAEGKWNCTYRFGGHRWFYPRGQMLPSGRILCMMRCQRDPTGVMWSELFYSDDGGLTWGFLSRVNDFGSPGSLVQLNDGRLVVVYGYRLRPQGIRAVVSEDEGGTWGPEIIVRDDGGSWDLGYPNAWAADDGRVGVIYYFNEKHDPVQANGGVRHIARSFFSVD